MRAPALAPRDRRALLLGAALMTALVLGTRVLPAVRAWSDAQHRRALASAHALRRAEDAASRRRWTRAGIATLDERLAVFDSATLAGTNATSAGTALSDAISEAAEAAEATLGSVQLRRDTLVTGTLTHVSASATLSGDIESLALFLETVEAGPPLLAVRQLSLTGGGALSPSMRETLRLEVLVEGVFANGRAVAP